MSFEAFDQKLWKHFREEAQARWGQTELSFLRLRGGVPEVTKEMTAIMFTFDSSKDSNPDDNSVQEQVKVLQHISQHFYSCDQTVLAGSGQMYQTDNAFLGFIDKVGIRDCSFSSQKLFASHISQFSKS